MCIANALSFLFMHFCTKNSKNGVFQETLNISLQIYLQEDCNITPRHLFSWRYDTYTNRDKNVLSGFSEMLFCLDEIATQKL